jgi:hypothetical protein
VTAILSALGAFIVFVLGTVVADLVSEEMRTRLEKAPQMLLRLAARKFPAEFRNEYLDEWNGELDVFLRRTAAMPLTRLWRGLNYAGGLLRASSSIAQEAGFPANSWSPMRQLVDLVKKASNRVAGPAMSLTIIGSPFAVVVWSLVQVSVSQRSISVLVVALVGVMGAFFALWTTCVGGFKYVTSDGNSAAVSGAKARMIYGFLLAVAIAGLQVILTVL